MGFDIYGLNPTIKKGSIKPEIDWDTDPTDEERNTYFEQSDKYEDENKGVYFRNNIWWWRPLVEYVYENTGEISEDDYNEWHLNSGYQVDEVTAIRIADTLEFLIKNGHTIKHQQEILETNDSENEEVTYPFNVENVERFAAFCRESGGFEIC